MVSRDKLVSVSYGVRANEEISDEVLASLKMGTTIPTNHRRAIPRIATPALTGEEQSFF